MDQDFSFRPDGRRSRKSPMRGLLLTALAAFLLGAAAVYLAIGNVGFSPGDVFRLKDAEDASGTSAESASQVMPSPRPTSSEQAAEEAREAVQRVERVVEQQGGLDQRVAAMEQRLTRLDLQAQAASGNVARAEGLLIAFATRRAIERGAPLGYLADQLRLRFGDARPNAVRTVIEASRDPVTLDQLIAQLDGLAPELSQVPADEGLFPWFLREMGQLFIFRREDTPSPAAESRLERARLFLETGRVGAAVAEIRLLPNAAEAREWIASAERFAAAQDALELLETTAILEPRELRDDTGNRVEQLSPASEDAAEAAQ